MARDYDPVKAHEYYMKHRKLKGRKKSKKDPRTSTRGFSAQQKEMAAYVKAQLKEELKAEREKLANERKAKKDQLKRQLKAAIASLKESGSDNPERLKRQIKRLRSSYKERSTKISDKYKADYKKAREANKETYAQEMVKIRTGKK